MWKKGDSEEPRQSAAPSAKPNQISATRRPQGSGERAIIGPSITIRGDVSGGEDLLVQGCVEGTIDLKKNMVTIGADGRVKANVAARVVTIEGEVEGDLQGEEQIILRPTARVQGNIAAPRVTLEDGAMFRGTIDMDVKPAKGAGQAPSKPVPPAAQTQSTPSTARTGNSEPALGKGPDRPQPKG